MAPARCASSFSIVACAVAQLLCNPAGYAQAPPAGEPEVHEQGSNVAPAPPAAYPPPPYTPPAGVPSEAAAGERPAVAGPVVSLYGSTPKAQLQAQSGPEWRTVCTSPCNRTVDPGGTYRIGGGTVVPSDGFRMPRSSGRVIVEFQHGSTIKRGVGLGLIIGGLVNGLLGGLYIAQADEFAKNDPNNGSDFYTGVGVGSIIHGAIVAIVGATLALSSTSVTAR